MSGYPNLMCFGYDLANCDNQESCPDYKECRDAYHERYYSFGRDVSEVVIRHTPVPPSSAFFEQAPCMTCSNNPANGGSGICHCILGQQAIY